jgi:NIMA (never in mitosis gene a)-related kinase
MSKNITKKVKETYTAIKFLGKGGFGEAYLVKSNMTKKNYVMKSINFELLDEKNKLYTINEAILLKNIDHPNIIKFKEVFEVKKPNIQLNIIMEYAENGDLNKLLEININKKIYFKENILINWLCQICSALKYIHYKKIIHRDIKPANIFMNNLGQIKLGDFGISKNLKNLELASSFVGSAYYTAPEMIYEEKYSYEIDIWALGVTFYELMNLKKPFRAEYPAIYLEIKNKEVDEINNIYSKPFRNLIYQMLKKNPKDRPKADDILNNLFIKEKIKGLIIEKINWVKSDKKIINEKFRIKDEEKENNLNKNKFKIKSYNEINLENNKIKDILSLNLINDNNNINDTYNYDLQREINIFNSILSGDKSDEEIEKENNLLKSDK